MKNILVPTDFSQYAQHAFRFAVELSRQAGGVIHLVHVIELPILHDTTLMPTLSFEQEYLKDASASAERKFKQLIKSVKGETFITASVEYGAATQCILDCASTRKSDLILMGTRGATGLKEYFVGSNTEKIVRLAKVPVLSIPAAVSMKLVRNLILPTSLFGKQDDLVRYAVILQKVFKARLQVLYVNTPALFRPDHQSADLLEQFARNHGLKDYELNIWNDISEDTGVVNFAARTGSCLVVMSTHGRRGLAHLMTGSIAEDVVNHIHFPVWSFKPRERKRR